MGALAFAILIGLGASWRVPLPFTPVPVTGQTLFLFLGASVLTRHYALEMIGWYLLFGVLGAPFLANQGSGFAYLMGPTGGYLLGFLFASAFLGYGVKMLQGRWPQLLLFFLTSYMIFIPGVLWLQFTLNLSFGQALQMGYFPFLIGDLLKVTLAFSSFRFLKRIL